jgi:hypothetical protein
MARVLLIGVDPDEVDFSDPALPPGMNADVIRKGIVMGLEQLRAAGHEAEHFYIPADPGALGGLADKLAQAPVDCVTVGGGVRLPPHNLHLFEAVLNTIARATPTPVIGLVSRPDEAPQAVARALGVS